MKHAVKNTDDQSVSTVSNTILWIYVVFMSLAPLMLWVCMIAHHKGNLEMFTKMQVIFLTGMNFIAWWAAALVYYSIKQNRFKDIADSASMDHPE